MPRGQAVAFAGKVVIVTGASSGIGAATALQFAREGAKVAFVARRKDRLDDLVRGIHDLGGEALAIAVDLADRGAPQSVVAPILKQWGRVDVLINNAARGLLAPFEETTAGEFRELFELNVIAVLTLTQAVLPVMRRQGSGHLITVSSIAGRHGTSYRAAYGATKFALVGMMEALRQELRGFGIAVSVIYPVNVLTEFQRAEVRKIDVPLRGPVQTAEQVAQAIVRCVKRPCPDVYPYRLAKGLAVLSVVAPSVTDALAASASRGPDVR